MHYEVRNSLIDRTTRYSLEQDGISFSSGRGTGHLAYKDIARLNLSSFSGGGGETLQCRLAAVDGARLTLRSRHLLAFGKFEDRTGAYVAFLRELLRQVADKAPNARCSGGGTALAAVWIAVAAILALGLVVALFVMFDTGGNRADLGLWGFVAFCVVAAPFVASRIKHGGTRRFDPADPPARLTGSDIVA
ncbi:MAG: hypothetical protein KKH72_00835 [Alphaproteobacteria bacterium]|nr:hypothetical protein [Alphaproteobacteria bacterium]